MAFLLLHNYTDFIIYIEDGVLIGHNAVLATINHMEDPEKRAGMILQPEQLKQKMFRPI